MTTMKTQGIDDVLLNLCDSVCFVLNEATQARVHYSAMVQSIQKTSLRPDIGCFVLFDGGFAGLVVINFSAAAAMELYTKYLSRMGIDEKELAKTHTAPDVSNVMGELMNQIVGDFTRRIQNDLQTSITQSQPKMLVLNKQVMLQVDTNLDRPKARRISFYTGNHHVFYVELAMDDVVFFPLNKGKNQKNKTLTEEKTQKPADDNEELLRSLGM